MQILRRSRDLFGTYLPAGPKLAKEKARFAGLSDAPARNRTWNLRIKSPLLCQLSYRGWVRPSGQS